MKRHVFSHAMAVLVCTVTGALLVDIVRRHIPYVYRVLQRFAHLVINLLELPYDVHQVSIVLYAVCIAALWGAAFARLSDRW